MGTVRLPGNNRFAAALWSRDEKISRPLGQFMVSLWPEERSIFGQIEK